MDTICSKSFTRIASRQVMWQNHKVCLNNRYLHKTMNENNVLWQFQKCVLWQMVFLIDWEDTFSVQHLRHNSEALLAGGIFWNYGLVRVHISHGLGLSEKSQQLVIIFCLFLWDGSQWIFKPKGNEWCGLKGTVVAWRGWALGNYTSVLAIDARRECGQGFWKLESLNRTQQSGF